MAVREDIKKLSSFIPMEEKRSVLDFLLKKYQSEQRLAQALGLDVLLVKMWKTEENIGKKFFPQILALALQHCPQETKKLLRERVLNELNNLCTDLDILKQGQKSKSSEFLKALDAKSRAIVLHLIRSNHAKIRELSELIEAKNDTITLTKIREVINPLAEKIFAKQIMRFKESEISPSTGEKILFSWWLENGIELIEKREGEMFDVFDEKNHLKIVAELPDVKEKDIEINAGNGVLTIAARGLNASYRKSIPLFYPIKGITEKTFKNGILEIKLKKMEGE